MSERLPPACLLFIAATLGGAPPFEPVLYSDTTPASEIMTLPGPSGSYVSIRAERREVTVWGQRLAVLLYCGPRATQQRERHDGRYSLIVLPRRPVEQTQDLERDLYPRLRSPTLSTGGLRGLAPREVPAPDDPRLERFLDSLTRAAWWDAAARAGEVGGTGRALTASARRFRQQILDEGERDGFLHEAQHALDEAWRVFPERFRNPAPDEADAELRAMLAAVAHASTPHHVLFFAVRQYRQRLSPYEEAVRRLLSAFAAEVLASPEQYRSIQVTHNVPLQIPRLSSPQLRALASRVMEKQFAEGDRLAGYRLTYAPAAAATGTSWLGSTGGEVDPDDLPDWTGAAATWRVGQAPGRTSGMHIFFSEQGVRPAQAGTESGLSLGPGGYLAVHLRARERRLQVTLTGGLLEEDRLLRGTLPVEILAGESTVLRPEAGGANGLFRTEIPAAAARNGVLRLVLRPSIPAGPAAFLTEIRVEPASP